MKCKNCKAFVLFGDGPTSKCNILSLDHSAYLTSPENDCLIDEWVLRRDEINAGNDGGGCPRDCKAAEIADVVKNRKRGYENEG